MALASTMLFARTPFMFRKSLLSCSAPEVLPQAPGQDCNLPNTHLPCRCSRKARSESAGRTPNVSSLSVLRQDEKRRDANTEGNDLHVRARRALDVRNAAAQGRQERLCPPSQRYPCARAGSAHTRRSCTAQRSPLRSAAKLTEQN